MNDKPKRRCVWLKGQSLFPHDRLGIPGAGLTELAESPFAALGMHIGVG